MPNPVSDLFAKVKLIPVLHIKDAAYARGLADSLHGSGLPVAEITLRSDCALDAIKSLSGKDTFVVGAGTVLNVDQARTAVNAGAQFIVSPGFDENLVRFCLQESIPVFPGAATATEVQRAANMGLDVVKFFPAEASGGIAMLKALSGPFHKMKFIPTGGITNENLASYLDLDCVLAVGGSWFVKPELYGTGEFALVEKLATAATKTANRIV